MPAAVVDVIFGDKLPEAINEKAEYVQSQGGIAEMKTKLQSVFDQHHKNLEMYGEVNGESLMVIEYYCNSGTSDVWPLYNSHSPWSLPASPFRIVLKKSLLYVATPLLGITVMFLPQMMHIHTNRYSKLHPLPVPLMNGFINT